MDTAIGVVILDDEVHIIRLLRALLPWEAYGLVFLGSAQNGIEGKRLVEETHPDIVFTDIKMPGLSGLELIASLSSSVPDTSFVIVSGYGQFDYAKQAITYGVEDYLLKPIDQKELSAVIAKLVGKIHSRHQTEKAINASKNDQSLLDGIQHGAPYPISSGARLFLVALQTDSEEPILSPDLSHAVTEKLRLILQRYPEVQGIVHVGDLDLFSLVLEEGTSVSITGLLDAIAVDVLQIRQLFPSLSFTLCVTESKGNLASDHSLLASSLPLRRDGQGNILSARQTDPGNPVKELSSWEGECDRAMDSLDSASFRPAVEAVASRAAELNPVAGEALLRYAGKRLAVKAEERTGSGFDWYEDVFSQGIRLSHTTAVMKIRFVSTILAFIDTLNAARTQAVIRPVRQALEYMQAHYRDSDMSLDTVASVVGLSAPYFSGLFKKERDGQGFQDALVQIRIDQAKELLRTTHQSIGTIANEVGYSDVKYFTKLFRKTTGVKPNEYRSLYG
ncbi:MAG: response regulator [Sphaerochaeta sp.]|jgi:two-component system response regulator YesN|nr:response regulator [Sphaerochaeta sp.]